MNHTSGNHWNTIRDWQEKIGSGLVSPTAVTELYAQRFAQYNQQLGAALELFDMGTQQQAGPLLGIPGLIKDNICQKDRITSCASKMLANYKAPYDATAVVRLKQAGAPLIGRANMDEFAMGSSTETSAYFPAKNPWDQTCVPGGSSGGSAVAVAAGLVPWALGSETGGSVRQPAAFCGIIGLKPTYGLISRYGLIAYASSLDQIGIFTRTAYDTAIILSIMAGHDPHDATSRHKAPQDYTKNLDTKLKPGIKIGIITNMVGAAGVTPEVSAAIRAATHVFEKLGAQVGEITIPTCDYGAAVYFMISRAEAASNLARFNGIRYGHQSSDTSSLEELVAHTRSEGFGYEVKRRIILGNYVLSAGHADAYYASAKQVQQMMRQEFMRAFEQYDLLIAPTAPSGAFTFGAFDDNKLLMDLQDYFTAPANLTGIPAISLPCGFTTNPATGARLPLGFQIMGPELSEELILQVSHAYQQATAWHLETPNL